MDKKIGEIELDLQNEILEGWEDYDLLNVEILNEARELGHTFPLVDVVRENGVYRLRFGCREDFLERDNYGGHSRSIVALQRREILKCNIYKGHRDDFTLEKDPLVIYSPINELSSKINLHYNSLLRLKINLDFLPKELRERFLKSHDLIMYGDVLMTQDNYDNPPPF